ncbi:MAG: hypothetical protein HYZ12_03840 [Thaumarchaeota archaeon]|nr:hypothetical protein [Nitrososphaerota archaeon]
MAEKIPGWLERLLLPRLSALEGELKAFRGEVDGEFRGLRGELNGLRGELNGFGGQLEGFRTELKGLRGEMEGGFKAVHSDMRRVEETLAVRLDGLEKRGDVLPRLAVLETRVTELEDKRKT